MADISRRKALGILAAATVAPTTSLAATPPIALRTVQTAENPDLLIAYDRFIAASAELKEAKSALEWLADEWRHVWPLAPEDILGVANAHQHNSRSAERDIIGNYLIRDTSALTSRFSRKDREQAPNTCFSVLTPEEARKTIEEWEYRAPTGRTEKALHRYQARREQAIKEYQHKLSLAVEYQLKTSDLRERSGATRAQQRRTEATAAMYAATREISTIPAFTREGLLIKVEAIKASGIHEGLKGVGGIISEMARFVDAALAVHGGGAAL